MDRQLTEEERECEEHFTKNTTRDASGRFLVRLPFKPNWQELGNSYNRAKYRFFQLEKKLSKLTGFKSKYSEFLQEYKDLNHMKLVIPSDEESGNSSYYMPHHAVIKEESVTTKLRVVFDASATSSSGLSLNDALMVGPKV